MVSENLGLKPHFCLSLQLENTKKELYVKRKTTCLERYPPIFFYRLLSRKFAKLQWLHLTTGSKPLESKGTRVIIPISDEEHKDKDQPSCWSAKCSKIYENFLKITVKSPTNCAVAKWRLSVDARVKTSDGKLGRLYRFQQPESFYILFNPWCQGE